MENKSETLGQLSRRLRKKNGLTQGQVEEYAKIDRTWLSKLEADKWIKPDHDRLTVLARLYRVPPETLLARAGYRVTPLPLPPEATPIEQVRSLLAALEREPTVRELRSGDIVQFPLDGKIPAGYPNVIEDDHEPLIGLTLTPQQRDRLRHVARHPRALIVQGDSMAPKIKDAMVVIYDPDRTHTSGDVVVALVDGESTLKRLIMTADATILKADNPKYPEIVIRDELRGLIQGVVVARYPMPTLEFMVATPAQSDSDDF